jgi:hypothetical protein
MCELSMFRSNAEETSCSIEQEHHAAFSKDKFSTAFSPLAREGGRRGEAQSEIFRHILKRMI